jgi:hypothetical protein
MRLPATNLFQTPMVHHVHQSSFIPMVQKLPREVRIGNDNKTAPAEKSRRLKLKCIVVS